MPDPFRTATGRPQPFGRPGERRGHALDVGNDPEPGRAGSLPGSGREIIEDREAARVQLGENSSVERPPITEDHRVHVMLSEKAAHAGAEPPAAEIYFDRRDETDRAAVRCIPNKSPAARSCDRLAQPRAPHGVENQTRIVAQQSPRESSGVHVARDIAGDKENRVRRGGHGTETGLSMLTDPFNAKWKIDFQGAYWGAGSAVALIHRLI